MFTLALKSVRHNPKRLILTAVAVALGVSLVSATFSFTNSFSRGFDSLFDEMYSSVDVIVEPDPDSDVDINAIEGQLSAADVEAISNVEGVSVAVGKTRFYAGVLLNAAGDAPLKQGPPTLIENVTDYPELDNITLIDGVMPTAAGEVIVDVDTFDLLEAAIGDTALIATEEGVHEVTVVGTLRFGEDNNIQTASFLLADELTVRDLAGGFDGYHGVSVTVEEGASASSIAATIDQMIPDTMRALTAEDKIKSESEALGDALTYVDIFAIVFALVALFVGAYIIVNTFRIIVTQRTREIGLLRAIGSRGSQIRSMILLEAAAVGLLSSTIGILAGWLLALAGAALVEMGMGDIMGSVILPADAVVWGYSLGIAVTVVAAFMPAVHASRISPMEALREAGTAGKKPLHLRNLVGGVMSSVGLALVLLGLYAGVTKPAYWVGTGAVFIVLGVTLLAAQVLVPLAYGLRGALDKTWGVTGKLAANNIRREPRRSANTAAALMIGVMLLALVATFTESVKATFTDAFDVNNAELIAQANFAALPQGAVDLIDQTEGVRSTMRFALDTATVEGTEYSLGTLDAATADAMGGSTADRPTREVGEGVFISPTLVDAGYDVGDTITVVGPEMTLDLEVTGRYLNEGDNDLMVDWATGELLTGEPSILQVLIDFDDAADAEATEAAIEANLADDYPLVDPQTPDELQKFYTDILDLLIAVISGLLGAALIIAILGVANTLLLSVTERTRELGLLRAVGVKRRAVWSMITLESVVMAVFGTILGIILGVGLGAALVDSLAEFGFSGVAVPWMWIAVYTALSMAAGVLAAVWPAWRASRLDILKAIATDG